MNVPFGGGQVITISGGAKPSVVTTALPLPPYIALMAYDPGAIDATLAAAVGDEPTLIAELRIAFLDSADRSLIAMENAGDAETWRSAAWRLKGLAASFGAVRLMSLSTEAAELPRDAAMLGRLKRAVARL